MENKISLFEQYTKLCQIPSDINEHLETLNKFAYKCDSVTEVGTRYGVSTIAFMNAFQNTGKKLTCYDIERMDTITDLECLAVENGIDFKFYNLSILDVVIEPTDFLFIDSLHEGSHLRSELSLHGNKARKFIGFHDTTTFGQVGQNGGEGLKMPIRDFMNQYPEWEVVYYTEKNNGLMIIGR